MKLRFLNEKNQQISYILHHTSYIHSFPNKKHLSLLIIRIPSKIQG